MNKATGANRRLKKADYAFRLRSASYGGQVGFNPPYELP